jgi:hypothetical protein
MTPTSTSTLFLLLLLPVLLHALTATNTAAFIRLHTTGALHGFHRYVPASIGRRYGRDRTRGYFLSLSSRMVSIHLSHPPPPPLTYFLPHCLFAAVPSTAGAATEDIWPQGPREGGGRPKRLRRRRKRKGKRSLPGGVCKSWRRNRRRKACTTCRSMPGTSLRRTPLRDRCARREGGREDGREDGKEGGREGGRRRGRK